MSATKSQAFVSVPKKGAKGDISVDFAKGLAVSAANNLGKFIETHYAMVRDFSEYEDGRSLVTYTTMYITMYMEITGSI